MIMNLPDANLVNMRRRFAQFLKKIADRSLTSIKKDNRISGYLIPTESVKSHHRKNAENSK